MAVCLRSAFRYNSFYAKAQFSNDGRLLGRGLDPNNGGVSMVKFWLKNKRSMRTQILKNIRICCGLDSRFYNFLSNERTKIFSLCNIKAGLKSKDRFSLQETVTLIAQREWSQFVVVVAVVLALSLAIIPNADAVDALKTCTCLLKECRYCTPGLLNVLEREIFRQLIDNV